jgi:diguanylate cyclase (GGDEF)-like protein
MHVDERGSGMCEKVCPVLQAMEQDAPQEVEAFLHHRDGHRVPVRIRAIPVHDRNGSVIGAVEFFTDISSRLVLQHKIQELEKLALVDALTGLANRRYVEMSLTSKLEQMRRFGWGFGVMFIDIDDFKDINDRYGHDTGDQVLKMVAMNILHHSRAFDTPGRWGGEEFIILSDNVSDGELRNIAERYRILIESSGIPAEAGRLGITVSSGATLAGDQDTAESLVKRADRLMYDSKRAGKNRVTVG